MPVEKKLPPVRLVVSKDYFNKLVELTSHIDYLLEEVNSKTSLYDKLMKYTFLEDNEQVELRFFAGEASEVILLLLCNLKDGEISKDYYKELIQTRKKYKEEKNSSIKVIFNVFKDEDAVIYHRLLK